MSTSARRTDGDDAPMHHLAATTPVEPIRPRNTLRPKALPQPPFPDELVATLHAGGLDQATADYLWPAVLADPDAAALIRSLDTVRSELAALDATADHGTGPHPDDDETSTAGPGSATEADQRSHHAMPPLVAARLRHALIAASDAPNVSTGAGTASQTGPSETRFLGSPARAVDLDVHRRRKRRKLSLAAAAVVGAVLIAAPTVWIRTHHDAPELPAVAADESGHESSGESDKDVAASDRYASDVHADDLGPAQILRVRESTDPGPFRDPARLAACLSANDLPPHAPILGAGPVEIDGAPATLLLVPGPHPPMLTGIAVTSSCGTAGPGLLYRTDIGG